MLFELQLLLAEGAVEAFEAAHASTAAWLAALQVPPPLSAQLRLHCAALHALFLLRRGRSSELAPTGLWHLQLQSAYYCLLGFGCCSSCCRRLCKAMSLSAPCETGLHLWQLAVLKKFGFEMIQAQTRARRSSSGISISSSSRLSCQRRRQRCCCSCWLMRRAAESPGSMRGYNPPRLLRWSLCWSRWVFGRNRHKILI